MTNYFPEASWVRARYGYEEYSTGVGSGDVLTLLEFNDGTTQKLIAASATNLYDATSSTASSLKGSLTNGRWHGTNFNGRLFIGNGADTAQVYNGSTMSNVGFTGPTLNNVIGFQSFKSRLYCWEDNGTSFWYGGVNTISGAFTEFDLSGAGATGGKIMMMEALTIDGGSGVDDYAVFIMDNGEVIIYQGSNPGSASDWALVGVFRIGRPLGRRCAAKVGGDLIILTEQDYVLLSQAIRERPQPSKISGAVRDTVASYSTNSGWQVVHAPDKGILVGNVPVSSTEFDQHVANLKNRTGGEVAWCKYEDIPARVWGLYDGDLYFGAGDGKVYKAETTYKDGASNISGDVVQAFSNLGVPQAKRVTAFRPLIEVEGAATLGAGISYDYVVSDVTQTVTTSGAGTAWGSAWGSAWLTPSSVNNEWRAATGRGFAVSPRLRTQTGGQEPRWYRTDFLLEGSGPV